MAPTKIASLCTLAGGAASGAGAVYFYSESADAYKVYEAKIKSAQTQHDPQLSKQAQDFYDGTLAPRRTGLYVTAGLSAALLGTGTVLLFVDETPGFTPLPGGGIVTWSGRF